jgi:Probable lipoprotein LpqN
MKRLTAATGGGIAVLALTFVLTGCGSDSDTASSSNSTSAATSSDASTAGSPDTSAPAAGKNKTIGDYVKENNIVETNMKRGDPGPNINVPSPPGWAPKQGEPPPGTYGAILYSQSAVPNNPPRILAMLSKLTGNVDPAQILKYAPGELNNLPGFVANTPGGTAKLSGFDAVQISGNYADGDKKGMVAQNTVVIPQDGAVYVLQFNAFSDESEAGILSDAMKVIDQQTTITP